MVDLVRLGSRHDGGYFLPKSYKKIRRAICAGIGNNYEFESDLAKTMDIIYLIDGSISAPTNLTKNMMFLQQNLGIESSQALVTLGELIEKAKVPNSLEQEKYLLKMDIEGAEWEILEKTDGNVLEKCKIMVLELHDLRNMIENHSERTIAMFNRLLETHRVAWSGVNNYAHFYFVGGKRFPNVIELLMLSNDHEADKSGNFGRVYSQNDEKRKSFRMPFSTVQSTIP